MLVSHRRGEVEEDERLRRLTLRDLTMRFGKPSYGPDCALQAEPLESPQEPPEPEYAMTLAEIGAILGVSGQTILETERTALRKVAHAFLYFDLLRDWADEFGSYDLTAAQAARVEKALVKAAARSAAPPGELRTSNS